MIDFQGKVVLVSGAAQGLGAAMAAAFARAGASVVAADLNASALKDTAATIVANGGKCIASALDIRDPEACKAVAARAARELGPVSVLVNNAGITCGGTIEDADLIADIDRIMGVNLKGALNLTRACLPALKDTTGVVVNVASIASLVATFSSLPYAASKGALGQATKYMARQLADYGIRVNAVAPALVLTPMTSGFDMGPGSRYQNTLQRTMLKRAGTPEDVAGPVLFLASPLAQYITGHILPVDGGYTSN
jgi:meso-butanediol dehydrogenase / (S,S)-butanediol dehydrogenase / diacetyl reductase